MPSLRQGEAILAEVAEAAGMTVASMLEKSRAKELVAVRRQAIVRLRGAGFTLEEIGELMQGEREKPMHHSTVMHHLEVAKG